LRKFSGKFFIWGKNFEKNVGPGRKNFDRDLLSGKFLERSITGQQIVHAAVKVARVRQERVGG
jgi:hypothetical protein